MLARIGLKYPSKLHCEKVASFLPPTSRHEAVILAKGTEVKNRDNTDVELEFRQESNFYYLTGVQEADFYFIYDLCRERAYLVAPDLNPVKAVWKGPSPSDEELLKKYDVDYVVRYSNLLHLLKTEIRPKHILGWNQPEKVLPLGNKALEHELKHYISHRLVRCKIENTQEPSLPHHHRHHHHHDHGPYGDHHGHRCGHGRKHKHKHCHGHPGDHSDPDKAPQDLTLLQAMILARINKTPIEIALSREATRISSDAHRLIMKSARPGMYEYQLEALFKYECARQGGRAQCYLPIVGTGVNGAYLHYTRNDTQIKDGQLILIDAACEVDCYGSDVTRTFPVSGHFSDEQLAIYNLVLEMQTSVIRAMEKGVDWTQMSILSQKVGIRGLKRLGLLKGDEDDLFESSVIKVFYPHGLGHLLGLNVHDDGLGLDIQIPPKLQSFEGFMNNKNNKSLPIDFQSIHGDDDDQDENTLRLLPPPSSRRNKFVGSSFFATPSTKLEPGMVLTVEPGIYFNPAQIAFALKNPHHSRFLNEHFIRHYMPVGGVRIEDVVLILPDGSVENLTKAPKNPQEVEYIVQQGQREYQQSLQQDLGSSAGVSEKGSKVKQQKQQPSAFSPEVATSEPQGGIKKRVGVFKKLLRAIRRMF
ncbi:hypothetical protein BGX28_001105 [Mortierella sp. GBA30]|nr:hypothetical protein BGX28_001105 [Mortierella sp. GBA30]